MKNLIPLFLVLFITVLLAEVGVRALNTQRKILAVETVRYYDELRQRPTEEQAFPTHRPNLSSEIMNTNLKINSLGLRGEALQPDKKQLLILGDSIAMSWGNELNRTFFKKIEAQLGDNVQALSAGLLNTPTEYHKHLLKHFYKVYQPSAVLYIYYPTQSISQNQFPSLLERNFWAYSAAKKVISNISSSLKGESTLSYFTGLMNNKKQWQAHIQQLKKIKEFTDNKQIPFHIIMAPSLQKLGFPSDQYELYEKIKQQLESLGFSVSNNLFSRLDKYKGKERELWVANNDSHGNEVFQEALAQDFLFYFKESSLFQKALLTSK